MFQSDWLILRILHQSFKIERPKGHWSEVVVHLYLVQYYAAMYYNHSSMRKVHLVNGHVVYVYWIDTVYVQNNLPTEFSKRTIFHNLKKNILKRCNIS